ncbi:Uncharacterised protein [Mycobacteroides abscessus subsp. abscessus]|nr:Uncharacterised protein [Mycobacteroides abscessus subsp. abscessus]
MGIARPAICATADAPNSRNTRPPASAGEWMPSTWDTNDGVTPVNVPITANPANAAIAARTKTARVSGGTDSF